MPKLVWFILAVVLFLTGTYILGNVVFSVIAGYSVDYAMPGIVSACLFYYGTYRAFKSWKEPGVAGKQKEKKN